MHSTRELQQWLECNAPFMHRVRAVSRTAVVGGVFGNPGAVHSLVFLGPEVLKHHRPPLPHAALQSSLLWLRTQFQAQATHS